MDIDDIKQEYESGKSAAQISKESGINLNRVWKVLKDTGVKIRTRTEALQKYARYNLCVICGKSFRARKKWDAGGRTSRETCSLKCEREYKIKRQKECWTQERREYMSELFTGRDTTGWNVQHGEEKPNWKGGYTPSYYRNLAFNVYKMEKKCCISGCENTKCLCVHHIDEDRTNNKKENLEIRCKTHHTGDHSKDNQLWKKHLGVGMPPRELS